MQCNIGTNFRVLKVTLKGKGKFDVESSKHKVAQELMQGQGSELFKFFAAKIAEMAPEAVGAETPMPMGFTFSFPVQQTSINVGTLVRWTKGFTCPGVEVNPEPCVRTPAVQHPLQGVPPDNTKWLRCS